MQNIRRPVRRTFSEPTSAVAEGLRDHVRLMTTSVQPELALVVVRLSVATANRHGRYVRWTGRRTNTVRTTDLRTLAAGIAFQLVARRRYWRYGVGCNQRENKSVKPIDGKLFDWNTNWRGACHFRSKEFYSGGFSDIMVRPFEYQRFRGNRLSRTDLEVHTL